ncbi:MAG: hypothetical protein ACJ749_07425 [Flavisolibacter sp.]|jgi:hypothetical protein
MSQHTFNFATDYERQHNLAVDMCAACIFHYRKLHRPLKAIYLSPRYYSLFRHWVGEKFGLEAALTMGYKFDDVNIEEGSKFQQQNLSVEFWPETIQAEA